MKKTILTTTRLGYLYDGSEKMADKLTKLKNSPITLDGGSLINTDDNTEVVKGYAVFVIGGKFMIEKGWRAGK